MTTAIAATTRHPIAHAKQLHHIDALLDELEQSINDLITASWGAADDGTTSKPCADGTGTDLAKRLIALSFSVSSICEYRKDLAQPGEL